ncbi:MAG: sigma-70 family RNA polymerase sigma factor [Solirubrobacteraceae bacterium]
MNFEPLSTADDNDLMRRVVGGDARAFEELYDRHSAQAFGLALYVTKRSGVAEEVTQDAFLGLWRSAPRFDPDQGTLRTWLLSMVRHRAIDALRKLAKRRRDVEFDDLVAGRLEAPGRPDEQVAAFEQASHTRALLTSLPETQRQVIELGFFSGLSQTEIATKLGAPVGTVKGRQRLALQKMHLALTGAPQPAGTPQAAGAPRLAIAP